MDSQKIARETKELLLQETITVRALFEECGYQAVFWAIYKSEFRNNKFYVDIESYPEYIETRRLPMLSTAVWLQRKWMTKTIRKHKNSPKEEAFSALQQWIPKKNLSNRLISRLTGLFSLFVIFISYSEFYHRYYSVFTGIGVLGIFASLRTAYQLLTVPRIALENQRIIAEAALELFGSDKLRVENNQ